MIKKNKKILIRQAGQIVNLLKYVPTYMSSYVNMADFLEGGDYWLLSYP